MDIDQLRSVIAQGESETVEFKTSTAQLKPAFETLCAFLNGKGGVVCIGINDQGKMIGQEVSDHTRQEIARELGKLEPTPQVDILYTSIKERKFVIFMRVDAGVHIPYIYNGRPFQRNQSSTMRMSQHRYNQLLMMARQSPYAWEEIIAPEYSQSDLDAEEIYKTVSDSIKENRIPASAQKEDVQSILERFNLIKDRGLKRAAIVLYARQASLKLVQCRIKLARFRGTNKLGEFIDNQQIQGNAFNLLTEADTFLRRHLPITSFFSGDQFKRIDKFALPIMAIREALVNAICHRDYADRSTDISLAIFDDRLEIWNSGLLPPKLTVDDLRRAHDSVLRNTLIANVFYVRGYIEKWGIGTNKMIDFCKMEGIPEPIFEERSGGLVVIFRFKTPISQPSRVTNAMNSRQEKIVEFLKEVKTATKQEILKYLTSQTSTTKPQTFSASSKTILRDLQYLQTIGLVYLKGQHRSAVWVLQDRNENTL